MIFIWFIYFSLSLALTRFFFLFFPLLGCRATAAELWSEKLKFFRTNRFFFSLFQFPITIRDSGRETESAVAAEDGWKKTSKAQAHSSPHTTSNPRRVSFYIYLFVVSVFVLWNRNRPPTHSIIEFLVKLVRKQFATSTRSEPTKIPKPSDQANSSLSSEIPKLEFF